MLLVSEHFLLHYTHSYLFQHQQTMRSSQVACKYFYVISSVSQIILKSLLPKVVQLPVLRKQWLYLTSTRTWRIERFPPLSSVQYSLYPVKPFACFTGNNLCLNENCLLTDFFHIIQSLSYICYKNFVDDLHRFGVLSTWLQMTGLILYYMLLLKSWFGFK